MAVAIRLMRFGKKHYPTYRIVALDKRAKRDGAYIEKIGIYQPMSNPHVLEWNQERLDYWLSRGAQLSEGMQKLMASVNKNSAPARTGAAKRASAKSSTSEMSSQPDVKPAEAKSNPDTAASRRKAA